jgi:hypothetical protein
MRVSQQCPDRPKLPAILIGATTQKLFRETFGREDLFEGQPVITRRVVAWGTTETQELPHSAVVMSELELLGKLERPSGVEDSSGVAGWLVAASRPLPDDCAECHFGARSAKAVAVRLREQADRSACWIESLENGWAFLIPGGRDRGWLLAVGDHGDLRFAGSRLVGAQIAEQIGEPATFPAHPRIAWPVCGSGWLACGTGALAFDPLCGDGSGHAVREGILAAAVLRAIHGGGSNEELLQHYSSRLLGGFLRHLATCETFYRTGGSSPWWRQQLEAVRDGLNWRPRESGPPSRARYRLRGFDLEPVSIDRPNYSF